VAVALVALATGAFVAGLSLGTAFLPSVLAPLPAESRCGFSLRGRWTAPTATAVLALGLAGLIAIGRWGCLSQWLLLRES